MGAPPPAKCGGGAYAQLSELLKVQTTEAGPVRRRRGIPSSRPIHRRTCSHSAGPKRILGAWTPQTPSPLARQEASAPVLPVRNSRHCSGNRSPHLCGVWSHLRGPTVERWTARLDMLASRYGQGGTGDCSAHRPYRSCRAGSYPARAGGDRHSPSVPIAPDIPPAYPVAVVGRSANYADVAQLVEQLPCKQQVVGSTPTVSSSERSCVRTKRVDAPNRMCSSPWPEPARRSPAGSTAADRPGTWRC